MKTQPDHHLRLTRERLTSALLGDEPGPAGDLARLFRLYTALYVLRLHESAQSLKSLYTPCDPDAEPGSEAVVPRAGRADPQPLIAALTRLAEQANYREVGREEIAQALTSVSPSGLEVSVDLEDFAVLRVFHRGRSIREQRRRDWRRLWLRQETVEVPVYARLLLCVMFKSAERRAAELQAAGLAEGKALRRVRRARRQLPASLDTDRVYLRLFKDIPHPDLETLFPNRRIRMRRLDKIQLGITGGGGTASGVVATLTKLSAAASPVAIAGALVGLALVIARQVARIINQRTKYTAVLTRSLYFQSMDNNFGVIARLLDTALEQECNEAMLAYTVLLRAPARTHDRASLDAAAEGLLTERFGLQADFDVAGGLAKLAADGLLDTDAEGRLAVPGVTEALAVLQRHWDAYPRQPER